MAVSHSGHFLDERNLGSLKERPLCKVTAKISVYKITLYEETSLTPVDTMGTTGILRIRI